MESLTADRRRILDSLGGRLAAAWRERRQVSLTGSSELPRNRQEACHVQDSMATALDEPLSGWKVGATSRKMREIDGHSDVIPGRIFECVTWTGPDVELEAGRFPRARVETEFAFRLTRDFPIRATPWTASEFAHSVEFHLGIEIIGTRFSLPDGSPEARSLMTVADNGGGIGFVFHGPVSGWEDVDLQNHIIRLQVDGGEAAANFLGDMRCVPLEAVADLANHLAGRGIALSSGHYVSTGAATVPLPVGPGSRVYADFGSLGSVRLGFV